MTSAQGGGRDRDIGARLRAARERQGMTVLQAAERLHSDARILEALEAEHFGVLGAEVYVRGHLRRYAELVGESPAELQELYALRREPSAPDLTRFPHIAPAQPVRPVMPVLFGLAVLLIGALSWWFIRTPSPKPQPVAAAAPPAAAAAPSGSVSSAAAPVTGPAAAAPEQLTLSFSGVSWVDVSDSTGRHLLQGLYARTERTLSGAAPLRVVIGNTPAVALQLNGAPVSLAGLVRRDGSARLIIDAEGHAAVAPPRLAHGD